MSRIVIDARQSGTSTGRYHDKLIENLHKLKPKHEFVILAHAGRLDALRKLAPDFKIVQTDYREFGFGEQLGFMRQIKKLKPDLVHFGMIQQPVLYRGRSVTSMLDLTPLSFKNPSVNPLIYKIRQSVFRYVCLVAAKKSQAIICISEYVKNEVIKYTKVSAKKITVTYNAADKIVDDSEPLPELTGKEFIMYVGRPTPHKNLTRLIEAFVLMKDKHPDLHLVLVGKKDPLYEEHERYVSERSISNVIFTGFASEGQLRWLYEHTACYVFPSLSEGFGLPGLEAMAHRAPVASSNATCLPEVYADAAAFFNPLDPQHMAMVVSDVITSPDLADRLRTRGLKQITKFSWSTTAQQTLDVYREVLGL